MRSVLKYSIFIFLFFTLIFVGQVQSSVIRTSEVSTVVTVNPDGSYTYNYTVKNTSPAPQWIWNEVEVWPTIVDFEIPLNHPSVVWNISSPEGWGYEFISYDEYILRYGEHPFNSPWVLHWYTGEIPDHVRQFTNGNEIENGNEIGFKPIVPGGYNNRFETNYYEPQTDGFIFTSFQLPVSGPYLASWVDEFRSLGDPPLPGGTVGGGGTPPFNPIPIPSTFLLLISAFAGLIGLKRNKIFKKF